MVGQSILQNKIFNLRLSELPHSLMLLGEKGCGKHTMAKMISNKLGYELKNITEDISLELMESIAMANEVYIYLIEINNISVREENIILKTLEEPPSGAYFILVCDTKNTVLPTIINRCQIWEFEKYTTEELLQFCEGNACEELLYILKTPGQILKLKAFSDTLDIKSLINRAEFIFKHIEKAWFANVLKLSSEVAFDDEDVTHCDFFIFVKVLLFVILQKIIYDGSDVWSELYYLTNNLLNSSYIPHINKQSLYEKYLLQVKLLLVKYNKGA